MQPTEFVTDIQNGSIDRGPTVLIRVLARLRRFGFGVSPCGAGVLGFCSQGETLAVCYVDKRRVSAGSDYGPTDATGADFALADIEVSLASDPDGPSLCTNAVSVCSACLPPPRFPQAWVSTTVAKGAEVVVSTPGELRRALVFSAVQELGQFLSRAAGDPADSRRGDNWLEQAKPQEPPIFDYRLLPTASARGWTKLRARAQKSGRGVCHCLSPTLVDDRYEARGLLDQFQRHGLRLLPA